MKIDWVRERKLLGRWPAGSAHLLSANSSAGSVSVRFHTLCLSVCLCTFASLASRPQRSPALHHQALWEPSVSPGPSPPAHPPLFSVPLPSLLSAVCFLECFSSLDFFLFILRKVFTRSSTSLPYSWGIFSFIWSLYTVVNFFYLICHCLPSSQFHCHPLSPRRWGSGMLSDSQDLRRHTTHSWDSENISGLLCPLSDLADSEWQTLQPAPGWIYFFLVLTQQLTHPSTAREPLPSALFNFLGLTSAHTFHEAWAPPAPSSSLFSFYQWGPHLCLSYIRPWRSLFLLGH